MATKVVATATVRAINRKLLPTRAAIVLVINKKQNFIGHGNCDGYFFDYSFSLCL